MIHLVEQLIALAIGLTMLAGILLFIFVVGAGYYNALSLDDLKPPKPKWRNEMYKDGDAEPGDKSPYDGSEFDLIL